MDYLTFVSKIFDATAWPVAAAVITFGLRGQLQGLMPLIKKFKAGPVEVELEHIKKELDDAKALAASAEAKAQVVAAKFDEGESEAELGAAKVDPEKSALTPTELSVLKAMCNGDFATRSITGVAKQTGLTKATTQSIFGSLIAKGLVEQTTNKDGQPRWFVTSLGRIVGNEN